MNDMTVEERKEGGRKQMVAKNEKDKKVKKSKKKSRKVKKVKSKGKNQSPNFSVTWKVKVFSSLNCRGNISWICVFAQD